VSTLYSTSVPRPLLVLTAAHCLHAAQSVTAAAAAAAVVQSSTAVAVASALLLSVVSAVVAGVADGSAVPAAGAVV
jgi:hypothetical protein